MERKQTQFLTIDYIDCRKIQSLFTTSCLHEYYVTSQFQSMKIENNKFIIIISTFNNIVIAFSIYAYIPSLTELGTAPPQPLDSSFCSLRGFFFKLFDLDCVESNNFFFFIIIFHTIFLFYNPSLG